jgi:molecular chaperone GrpE
MKTEMAKEEPKVETPVAEPADAELVSLKEKLAKAEQQKDDLLRTLADYDNSRKRAARDLEIERKFAHAKLAGDILAALDNLDRALAASKKAGEEGPLVQGVIATQALLLDVLKRHGITPIDAEEKPFDPNLHQAVQMMPSKDVPANNVLQVLQKGFMIHDRVLRPASVVVSVSDSKP